MNAAATGRAADPDLPRQPDGPSPLPLSRVVLLDPRSRDIRREYLASAPAAILGSLPSSGRRDRSLARSTCCAPSTPWITPRPARDGRHHRGKPAGQRAARGGTGGKAAPGTPVFVLAAVGRQHRAGPIFDLLHPFRPGLLVEDACARGQLDARRQALARVLPAQSTRCPPGIPKAAARAPWPDLHHFLRQDNILQLRSVLTAVAARGRQWAPVSLVPPGQLHRAERSGA